MDEISNKTLAVLLIGAMIVSLGGTLISLNKLAQIRPGGISGFAIGVNISRGNLSLTIQDLTWINFSVKTCNFGSGFVVAGTCWLNGTQNAGEINVTACGGFTPSVGCSIPLAIKNIGNNNVTLNITWTNSSKFFQATGGSLLFKIMNQSAWNNVGGGGCTLSNNMTKFNNAWQTVTREGLWNMTCDRFYYGNGRNTILMFLKVGLTQVSPPGFKQNIIRAYGRTKLG